MSVQVPVAPPIVVDPPTVTPPLHSLVASAPTVNDGEDRWQMGFTFWPENCVDASSWWPGCETLPPAHPLYLPEGAPSGAFGPKSNPPTNNPIQMYFPATYETAFQCDSTGWQTIDYQGRAKRQIVAAMPKALEHEFWTGTLIPGNFNLVANTPGSPATEYGGVLNTATAGVYNAVKPQDALAMLVGALASCGPGSRGMIHAPAQVAELWAETQSLTLDGPRLVTKTRGNIVVSGGGYPGTGPGGLATWNGGTAAGQAAPEPTSAWVYATDMVSVRVAEPVVYPDTLGEAFLLDTTTGRRSNQIQFRGEQIAAAYCGACCSFAVLTTMTGGT